VREIRNHNISLVPNQKNGRHSSSVTPRGSLKSRSKMGEEIKINSLVAFLKEQMPLFDELLSSENVRLSQRPLRAAILFVKYCVVEVKGDDDKEHPFGKRWFKTLYEAVAKWYTDRYAAALKTEEDSAVALVPIFRTAFRVEVPLALFAPRENNRVWVTLPNEVLPGEEVLKWIVNPPNLQTLDTKELKDLSDRVTEVATATRSIRINLMTADDPTKDLQPLISSIPLHIEKSVEDILIGDDASIGLAVWEMHLAVEKSLKLLIRQHSGTPSNTHDLIRLSELAMQVSGVTIDSTALVKLPSHREAIKARYGEGDTMPLQKVIRNYQTVLTITAHVTNALKRQFVFNNAKFQLRSPIEPE
jgi:hypothetical protein